MYATKAVIRNDGEHYRVYHNSRRLSGQYSLGGAREIRDAINAGKRTGCLCNDCIRLRNMEAAA